MQLFSASPPPPPPPPLPPPPPPPSPSPSLYFFFTLSFLLLFFLQNVITQQLLDQYLSMTDPARAQTVDTEIAKHCAFSLPGVALTLGRQNWHCLKDTYETLATDVQVRREKGNYDDNE